MPELRLTPPENWPTLGWPIVGWIETKLCHGPGDVEGDPILLDDEQVQFVLDAYRVFPQDHPKAGRRVVFDATYSRPKGRAKSELAGMIVCVEAKGPARFKAWDHLDEFGDLLGVPVRSPFIRCLATEEGQAGNTYDNVTVMLGHAKDRFPAEFADCDIGKTRVLIGASGEIRPSSSGAASKDGGKETFAVGDEVHLYVLPEHKSMWQMVRRNCRKRRGAQPWVMSTTTMYKPGENSVGEGRHEAARKAAGDQGRDLSVMFDHREAPVIKDWDDDRELLAALAHVYGDFAQVMDLEGLLSEIRDPETEMADSQRYFLNQRAEFADLAFSLEAWDACADPSVVVTDDALVVAGFDGARTDDSTALVVCEVATGHLWVAGLWERPENQPDWHVPESEVDDALAVLFDRFDVWRVYCDPPYWETAVARWSNQYGEKRIIEKWTNTQKPMAFMCLGFRNAMQNGDLSHDGDSELRRHVGNAYREELLRIRDENRRPMWRIRKERPGSPRKMDAAMAAVLAWEARTDAVTADAKPSKRRFVAPTRLR